MAITGYEPELSGCAGCGRQDMERAYFYAPEGAVFCGDCVSGAPGAVTQLLPETLSAMRHIVYSAPKKIFSFSLDAAAEAQLANPVDERGRVHGAPELKRPLVEHILAWSRRLRSSMEDKRRWRKPSRRRPRLRVQDKGRQCAEPLRLGRSLVSQGFWVLLRNVRGLRAMCGTSWTPVAARDCRTLRRLRP